MPDIELDGVSIEYTVDGQTTRPIDSMNRRIADGHLTLLLGPSGCGKTTLLSCLGGLLRPARGRVLIGDTDLAALSDDGLRQHRRRRVGFVFQSFNLIPSIDARSNVAAPLIAQGVDRTEALARADRGLARVGMADHGRSLPNRLSGGQQQRVAVARGLAHDPEVLLADEPTANLDYVQAEAVIQLLRSLAQPGRSVIIATHDDRLLPVADDVVDLTGDGDLALAEPTGPVALADGEVLFHEGDRGSLVYRVHSGAIRLTHVQDGTEIAVAEPGPGEYFGELGVMLNQPRTATATAVGPTELVSMTLQEFRVHSRGAAHAASEAATVRQRAAAPAHRRRREPLRATRKG